MWQFPCFRDLVTLGSLRSAQASNPERFSPVRDSRIGSIVSKRLRILLVGMATAVSMLAVAGTAEADHVPVSSTPTVSEAPDSTWMTNGRVYSVVRHGDYIYVGGKFTRVRQTPSGLGSFAATNLARFNTNTGVADKSWTPDVTGSDMNITQVYSLAAAGGKIWVGGKFDAVNGIARRNLAAVSVASPGVVNPGVDSVVGAQSAPGIKAIAASATKVYVGGAFSAVDGQGRRNLAAFDALSGNLDTNWRSKASAPVRTLALSCDDETVFAGGAFRDAAGSDGVYSPRHFIARFDATNGSLHPWAVPTNILVGLDETSVASDLAVTCERVTTGFLGIPNLVFSFRLDTGNIGSMAWGYRTDGNVQTAAMLGPDKVVIGGHFRQLNGVTTTGIALINLSDGSVDTHWVPRLEANFVSVWETYVDEQAHKVYIGGLFNKVESQPQTYFARFSFTP
jgi:hypothetical protein